MLLFYITFFHFFLISEQNTPHQMRSSTTRRDPSTRSLAFTQQDFDMLAMAQEDKLAQNVRLEQINASNKAVCSFYIFRYDFLFYLNRKFKL